MERKMCCRERSRRVAVRCAAGCLWGLLALSCNRSAQPEALPEALPPGEEEKARVAAAVPLDRVAELLSSLPLGTEQVAEVWDATSASAANGYDEEYRMQELFASPGAGVGDSVAGTRALADRQYAVPLRELIRARLSATRSLGGEEGMDERELSASDVQIYWPNSEAWDGETLPAITYDPGDNTDANMGYQLLPDGRVERILVDEQLASERPVWVVNRNADADYKSLELLRREDPSWGQGGGEIIVRPAGAATRSGEGADFKTLILRSFKAKRQYDSWFAGASEFFVKLGSVEDFTASTEAELRLYQPSVTDFMIVVRRGQVGQAIPFNAVLVSEWTDQLTSAAFMVIEDDGGTRTSWKCNAVVKYNSKSYGFEVEIPLYTRDDIVWRGALSRSYIERYSGTSGNFGDVELVLELI